MDNKKPSFLIPIKTAMLHQPVNAPGICGPDKTLNDVKNKGLKMSWAPYGMLVERNGARGIISHANVAIAIIDEQ